MCPARHRKHRLLAGVEPAEDVAEGALAVAGVAEDQNLLPPVALYVVHPEFWCCEEMETELLLSLYKILRNNNGTSIYLIW